MIKRTFWGIVLIALGILALLQGMNVEYFGLSFWPVVLTIVGLSIAWSAFTSRGGSQWFGLALGLWIGSMGLFTILHDAGVTPGITGGDIARNGWPILLIAIGVSVVFGRGPAVIINGRHKEWRRSGDTRSQVIGDLRYGRDPWVLEKDMNLDNAVGDVKVDLTTADITPGTHRITVTQFVGETVIKVPDNVTVRASGEASVGELEILGDHRSGLSLNLQREVVVPDSSVELIVDAHLRVGSLRVIRVPTYARVIE